MNKTVYKFDWGKGYTKRRRLSRSFKSLEDAQKFADGKKNTEIYKSKGMFKVEWTKIIDINETGGYKNAEYHGN